MRETIRGQTHKRQRKSRSAVRRFIRPWHSCLGNFRLARWDWCWVELNRIKVELFQIEVELFGTSNFLNEVEFFCSNRTFFTLVRRTADKILRYFFFISQPSQSKILPRRRHQDLIISTTHWQTYSPLIVYPKIWPFYSIFSFGPAGSIEWREKLASLSLGSTR